MFQAGVDTEPLELGLYPLVGDTTPRLRDLTAQVLSMHRVPRRDALPQARAVGALETIDRLLRGEAPERLEPLARRRRAPDAPRGVRELLEAELPRGRPLVRHVRALGDGVSEAMPPHPASGADQ
jgi:hypothetical protein